MVMDYLPLKRALVPLEARRVREGKREGEREGDSCTGAIAPTARAMSAL